MPKKLLSSLILLPLFFAVISAGTLQQAYQNAQPGMGYDRLIILDPDSVYTGGLAISGEKVGIKGFGALIDLAGDSIFVSANSQIDLDGCVIINGSAGLAATGMVSGLITQCTFYNNGIGIHFRSTEGIIEVKNSIIANSSRYGFACEESSYRVLHYIDSYQNMLGDYVAWCPG